MATGVPQYQPHQQPNRQKQLGAEAAHAYEAIVGHAALWASVIAASAVLPHDVAHIVLVSVGLILAVLAHGALGSEYPGPRARVVWLVVLLLGVGLGIGTVMSAADADDHVEQFVLIVKGGESEAGAPGGDAEGAETPGRAAPKENSIIAKPTVAVGDDAGSIAATDDGLVMLNATAVVFYDPDPPGKPTDSFDPDLVEPFDIAADGNVLVIVSGGKAHFIDRDTRAPVRSPYTFSNGPGHVAVTPGSAWLCDEQQAKVDHVDIKERGPYPPIPVPDRPTAILAAGGFVWVATDGGWLVRIDPTTGREVGERARIDKHASALAYGFGFVWIAHGEDRRITRVRVADTLVPLDQDIRVKADVVALEVTEDSVWALGRSTDLLQRIDKEGEVVDEERLTQENPMDIIAYKGGLFVTSGYRGTLSPLVVTPLWVWRLGPSELWR
jgi:hypothetical protein